MALSLLEKDSQERHTLYNKYVHTGYTAIEAGNQDKRRAVSYQKKAANLFITGLKKKKKQKGLDEAAMEQELYSIRNSLEGRYGSDNPIYKKALDIIYRKRDIAGKRAREDYFNPLGGKNTSTDENYKPERFTTQPIDFGMNNPTEPKEEINTLGDPLKVRTGEDPATSGKFYRRHGKFRIFR